MSRHINELTQGNVYLDTMILYNLVMINFVYFFVKSVVIRENYWQKESLQQYGRPETHSHIAASKTNDK